MGKKSLLKSTTRKKPTAKKKRAPKESVQATEPKKTALKQQTKARQEVAPAKKAATTTKPKAKPKTTTKTEAKTTSKAKDKIVAKATAKPKAKPKMTAKARKATMAKKPKVSLKGLLFRKFETVAAKGAVAQVTYQEKAALKIPDAPPFVTGYGKEKTKQIRALLFKEFDLRGRPPVEMTKKAAPTEKPKVSLKDLLFRKFETVAAKDVVSEVPYEEKAAVRIPDAPPFVTGYDKEETKRIRALLFKRFDLKGRPAVEKREETRLGEATTTQPAGPVALPEYMPPASVLPNGLDAMGKAMKVGLCGLAILIAIIVAASFSNRNKFYLKEVDGAVQVWRGKFAPAGTELVVSLSGMEAPNSIRDVYSKKDVNPIVFGYLQDKTDAVLHDPRGPDIAKIKRHLHQAASYAPTEALRKGVQIRLKSIDFVVLFLKADVAISRGRLPDLRAARAHLDKAGAYATSGHQRELVAKTKRVVDRGIAALEGR